MHLIVYYGFLLTEKDVIELFPGLLEEQQSLQKYTRDFESQYDDDNLLSSYLGIKITNKLIQEYPPNEFQGKKIQIGIELARSNSCHNSGLVIPEISIETSNIMNEFIENNDVFKNIKPVIFAYMFK